MKKNVAAGAVALAVSAACLGGLAGCNLPFGQGQEDNATAEQKQSDPAADQAVVDKVNAILQDDAAQFASAFGVTMNCTNFNNGTATVEERADLQQFLNTGSSILGEHEGGNIELTEEDRARIKASIEKYKAQTSVDSQKSSLAPYSQKVFSGAQEVTNIHWLVYFDDEVAFDFVQSSQDVPSSEDVYETANAIIERIQ